MAKRTFSLDIFQEKDILAPNSRKIGLPLNFQPNPKLMEIGMKACRRKVLKNKPPRDDCSLLEAFSFRG